MRVGDHLEDVGVDGRTVLRFQEIGWGVGVGELDWSGQRQVADTCDHGKGPSGFKK